MGLVGERPFDGGADVVVFPLDAGHRFGLVRPLHGGAGVGGQLPVVSGVSAAELLEALLVEVFSSVFGHRFQQPEASLIGLSRHRGDHRRVDQTGEKVEDLGGVHVSRRGHRFRSGKVEVTGEHRKPVEHDLLSHVE